MEHTPHRFELSGEAWRDGREFIEKTGFLTKAMAVDQILKIKDNPDGIESEEIDSLLDEALDSSWESVGLIAERPIRMTAKGFVWNGHLRTFLPEELKREEVSIEMVEAEVLPTGYRQVAHQVVLAVNRLVGQEDSAQQVYVRPADIDMNTLEVYGRPYHGEKLRYLSEWSRQQFSAPAYNAADYSKKCEIIDRVELRLKGDIADILGKEAALTYLGGYKRSYDDMHDQLDAAAKASGFENLQAGEVRLSPEDVMMGVNILTTRDGMNGVSPQIDPEAPYLICKDAGWKNEYVIPFAEVIDISKVE